MKNLILILMMLTMFNTFAETNKKEKTIFGNEYNVSKLLKVYYLKYSFYVTKNSPIAKIYLEDKFKFELTMSLIFDN